MCSCGAAAPHRSRWCRARRPPTPRTPHTCAVPHSTRVMQPLRIIPVTLSALPTHRRKPARHTSYTCRNTRLVHRWCTVAASAVHSPCRHCPPPVASRQALNLSVTDPTHMPCHTPHAPTAQLFPGPRTSTVRTLDTVLPALCTYGAAIDPVHSPCRRCPPPGASRQGTPHTVHLPYHTPRVHVVYRSCTPCPLTLSALPTARRCSAVSAVSAVRPASVRHTGRTSSSCGSHKGEGMCDKGRGTHGR